jgi:hypothetical protein
MLHNRSNDGATIFVGTPVRSESQRDLHFKRFNVIAGDRRSDASHTTERQSR